MAGNIQSIFKKSTWRSLQTLPVWKNEKEKEKKKIFSVNCTLFPLCTNQDTYSFIFALFLTVEVFSDVDYMKTCYRVSIQ